jgi:NADH-quinone oxidoreductase subunit F
MSKNLSELSGRKSLTNNLFERLGELSTATGTPDPAALEALAKEFLIGKANTYGAATFYDFMKPENKGKKVYYCNGTACLTAGTQDGLKSELGKHFEESEIGHICCLGRCHENGAFQLGEKNHSAKSPEEIAEIAGSVPADLSAPSDRYHVGTHGTPVLTLETGDVEDFYAPFLATLGNSPDDLLNEIKTSGMRGRGGAGFPLGLKLDSCKVVENETKFIVLNADEGDPGAYSDRYLLEERPQAVLQGMMAAGFVVGAKWGVVYIRAEYPEAIRIVQAAIVDLTERGLLGKNIRDTGFDFEFKVITARGAYICGEETALLSSIEGQRPEVRVRPPYPTQEGLFNKPTVVNNVETLAAVPWIIRHGGAAYKAIGTDKSSGTKLVCLDSFFNQPGMYEVDMGTSLSLVIDELAGGFKSPVKAVQIGGPLGGMVPIHRIKDLTVDFESFAQNHFLLGHGSVVCIPEDFPMIKFIEHLLDFTAAESCGKCFPCRLGSVRGQELCEKAQGGDYKIDPTLFDDLLHTLETGSLCALGGCVPLPIRNALEYFKDELAPYFAKN